MVLEWSIQGRRLVFVCFREVGFSPMRRHCSIVFFFLPIRFQNADIYLFTVRLAYSCQVVSAIQSERQYPLSFVCKEKWPRVHQQNDRPSMLHLLYAHVQLNSSIKNPTNSFYLVMIGNADTESPASVSPEPLFPLLYVVSFRQFKLNAIFVSQELLFRGINGFGS